MPSDHHPKQEEFPSPRLCIAVIPTTEVVWGHGDGRGGGEENFNAAVWKNGMNNTSGPEEIRTVLKINKFDEVSGDEGVAP